VPEACVSAAQERRPRAVLFDLDGTLIDSAPDLAGAANDLRAELGLGPAPFEQLRPMVGAGARGMLGAALGVKPGDERFDPLRERFLAIYEARMTRETRPFGHMLPVLDALEAAGLAWGIVTNKASRLTMPLVAALGLHPRAGTVIAGDTTPHSKPHPEPLFEAARRLALEPGHCWYVGDDHRDIKAGVAAGMTTVAVSWGYLGQGEPIGAWGADHVLHEPRELLSALGLVAR
jgi:N-acetyl-D-muramate 6-phosphate phosphatase